MKIKQCPFCGKPVTIYYSSQDRSYYIVHRDERHSDCIILMPIRINPNRHLFSLKDAYTAWNRRIEHDN